MRKIVGRTPLVGRSARNRARCPEASASAQQRVEIGLQVPIRLTATDIVPGEILPPISAGPRCGMERSGLAVGPVPGEDSHGSPVRTMRAPSPRRQPAPVRTGRPTCHTKQSTSISPSLVPSHKHVLPPIAGGSIIIESPNCECKRIQKKWGVHSDHHERGRNCSDPTRSMSGMVGTRTGNPSRSWTIAPMLAETGGESNRPRSPHTA